MKSTMPRWFRGGAWVFVMVAIAASSWSFDVMPWWVRALLGTFAATYVFLLGIDYGRRTSL